MLDITTKTIGAIFDEAVDRWPNEIFFVSPKTSNTVSLEISYSEAHARVNDYKKLLSEAGYRYQDRIALLLGNRVDHYLIKLAANSLGISIVPINPDASPIEILYILKDSKTILTITDQIHISLMESVCRIANRTFAFFNIDGNSKIVPVLRKNFSTEDIKPSSEASL